MSTARSANLLGALTVALGDELAAATEAGAGHKAACPAAIVSVGGYPNQSIENLRRALGLSHSGTVRLLDRLEAEGVVERRAGRDGRSVSLVLTPAGRRTYQRVQDARREAMAGALALLSPAEQTQWLRLTEKVLYGMTRSVEHSDHICRLCETTACPDDTCPVNCAALARG
jgi:DNA-binding MarR family transcriptional regulator